MLRTISKRLGDEETARKLVDKCFVREKYPQPLEDVITEYSPGIINEINRINPGDDIKNTVLVKEIIKVYYKNNSKEKLIVIKFGLNVPVSNLEAEISKASGGNKFLIKKHIRFFLINASDDEPLDLNSLLETEKKPSTTQQRHRRQFVARDVLNVKPPSLSSANLDDAATAEYRLLLEENKSLSISGMSCNAFSFSTDLERSAVLFPKQFLPGVTTLKNNNKLYKCPQKRIILVFISF